MAQPRSQRDQARAATPTSGRDSSGFNSTAATSIPFTPQQPNPMMMFQRTMGMPMMNGNMSMMGMNPMAMAMMNGFNPMAGKGEVGVDVGVAMAWEMLCGGGDTAESETASDRGSEGGDVFRVCVPSYKYNRMGLGGKRTVAEGADADNGVARVRVDVGDGGVGPVDAYEFEFFGGGQGYFFGEGEGGGGCDCHCSGAGNGG